MRLTIIGFRVDDGEKARIMESRRLYNKGLIEQKREPVSLASYLRILSKVGVGYLSEKMLRGEKLSL